MMEEYVFDIVERNHVLGLLSELDASSYVPSKWEEDFICDITERLENDGDLSINQVEKIEQIHKKAEDERCLD